MILKSLAREESARYPNAEAFADALAGLIEQFEIDPPQDDQADSALECSWDLDGSGDDTDTVTGWNQDTAIRDTSDDSALRIHDSAQAHVLETIPAKPILETGLENSRSRKARRRSSTKSKTLKKSSKHKTRSVRRSNGKARAVRAARRRHSEGMTRYLAFIGPAVALGVGLLLLL